MQVDIVTGAKSDAELASRYPLEIGRDVGIHQIDRLIHAHRHSRAIVHRAAFIPDSGIRRKSGDIYPYIEIATGVVGRIGGGIEVGAVGIFVHGGTAFEALAAVAEITAVPVIADEGQRVAAAEVL